MVEPVIAFQGEHGAYSEEAIRCHFGTGVTALPCESFAAIFETIKRGDASGGMLPVDNALAGTVAQAYELLMEHDFRVQGEHILPVRHCLLAPPGKIGRASCRERGEIWVRAEAGKRDSE